MACNPGGARVFYVMRLGPVSSLNRIGNSFVVSRRKPRDIFLEFYLLRSMSQIWIQFFCDMSFFGEMYRPVRHFRAVSRCRAVRDGTVQYGTVSEYCKATMNIYYGLVNQKSKNLGGGFFSP